MSLNEETDNSVLRIRMSRRKFYYDDRRQSVVLVDHKRDHTAAKCAYGCKRGRWQPDKKNTVLLTGQHVRWRNTRGL